jgi:CheY-like chemotaxis protein
VLVIDDEPAIGRLLATVFAHHQVEVVTSGEHGLARLRESDAFDVVVCDLMMPRVSGIDVYDVIAEERPGLERRFVFMSGGAFTERSRTFLDRIPNQRVDKPFTTDQLEAAMLATAAEAEQRG